MNDRVEVSVIVPVGARHDDIRALYSAYKSELDGSQRSHEFIYVLDGNFPGVLEQLKLLQEEGGKTLQESSSGEQQKSNLGKQVKLRKKPFSMSH